MRSPPCGHAHAAHVPPHPNAAPPREPGFAVLPCAGCQSSPDVRDWASPVAPLTRVGTSVRCVLSPLSSLLVSGVCSASPRPPYIMGLAGWTIEARQGAGSPRIRHAIVRWHHPRWINPPPGGEPPRRVSIQLGWPQSHPAVLRAAELRPHSYLDRISGLDPLRRFIPQHMRRSYPAAGGRPGSLSRIRTVVVPLQNIFMDYKKYR